jgi:GNAT superfamily N-acetyltransferase
MNAFLNIRVATIADAECILRVHSASVHGIASQFYPVNVLENWNCVPGEGLGKSIPDLIADGVDQFLVAEVGGDIRGFGAVCPCWEQITMLYVDPAFGRRGIGSKILKRLEELAFAQGATRMTVYASINAERFYGKNGYSLIDRCTFPLASGIEMACVLMAKG